MKAADDHGDGIDADAAVQGEDALPGDLVDEPGGAAHEERQRGEDQLGTGATAGVRSAGGRHRLGDGRAHARAGGRVNGCGAIRAARGGSRRRARPGNRAW